MAAKSKTTSMLRRTRVWGRMVLPHYYTAYSIGCGIINTLCSVLVRTDSGAACSIVSSSVISDILGQNFDLMIKILVEGFIPHFWWPRTGNTLEFWLSIGYSLDIVRFFFHGQN